MLDADQHAAFTNGLGNELAGLSSIKFNPANLLSISYMNGLFSDEALDAYELLGKIAISQKETNKANAECSRQIAEMGFPPFYTGGWEVPFDVIGDYYRGTIPTLLDQLEHEEEMIEFCDRIADIEIASFQRFRNSDAPVKRVFFPMHKGMDGFMSAEQYETRLEQLRDLPKGKCIMHC